MKLTARERELTVQGRDDLIFTARPLRAHERKLVFPLVSFRYPAITVKHWTDFTARVERAYSGADHLMAIVDSRGHFHAIFAYCVEPCLIGAARLRVVHIASASLVGEAINRAFHAALEKLAREHDCGDILIEVEGGAGLRGCDEPAALERAGFTQTPTAFVRHSRAAAGS